MKCLSVTKDQNGLSGIVQLNIDDIAFLEFDSRSGKIFIHTIDNNIFYTVGSLKYWTEVLNNTGYRFFVADRNNSVHIDNIVEMNGFLKVAYFERNRTENSRQCTMSKSGYKEVSQLLHIRKSSAVYT
ncbi:LytTR family transcriptional regulator DNA-binding domain-containing protein [Paenibacillus wynnii]|uniref:LytTR family transcriptional regulator DNA-binding domain-containing protein n=1 Tax=Paenibacillus wynnii TaxID=268407 RepID=UPI0027914B1E|nr:DNA-binding LytR/AlgR family response regulator [Paenibacillus wynnii]